MLWKSLLQVSCLVLCAGPTQGRIYTARKKPASSSSQRHRMGPHMCHSPIGAGSGCCPGWAPSPSTGQCVLPICPFGCGSGSCIAPNVCSCRGGQQGITCPDEGAATDFLVQYVEGIHGKASSLSCLSMMCEQSCQLISGMPVCSCFHGYSLSKDGRSCYDVDECSRSRGPGLCQQQCRNSLGSYRCYCYHGYQIASNGRSCIPVKAMAAADAQGACGEYGCTLTCNHGGCEHVSRVCPPGFTMSEMVNGVTCTDIDECETASCEGICLNTDGGFVCECRPGMQLSADRQSCVDIDECSGNRAPCQQRCRNSYGSYRCSCSTGFHLQGNGHSCTDINECRRPGGARLCQHSCHNTFGSFLCVCRAGFRLNVDKVTCDDVDECSLPANHTPPPCLHLCTNTVSSYFCSCHQGYQLAPDGHSCEESTDAGAAPAPVLSSHPEGLPTRSVPPYPRGFMNGPPAHPSFSPSHYYFRPTPGTVPPPWQVKVSTSTSLHSSTSLPVTHPSTPSVPAPTTRSVGAPLTGTLLPPTAMTKTPVELLTAVFPPPILSSPTPTTMAMAVPLITSSTARTPPPPVPPTAKTHVEPITTTLLFMSSPDSFPKKPTLVPLATSPSMSTPISKSLQGQITTTPPAPKTHTTLSELTSRFSGTLHALRTPWPTFTATLSQAALKSKTELAQSATTLYPPLAQKASKVSHISLRGDISPPPFLQPTPESPSDSMMPGLQPQIPAPLPGGCLYQGEWHTTGSHWTERGCLYCTCLAGSVLCENVNCSVSCSHPVPVPGQCCPSCEGCLYDGIARAEGDVFPLTFDDCSVCICIAGNVTCISPDCPPVTCLDPVMSECCLRCPAQCIFHGRTLPHGAEFNRDGDKCSSCVCRNGEVECTFAPCPTLDCPREDWLLEPGQCCFRCQELLAVTGCPVDDNGIEFPIGQIWSPGDPCEICVCQADSSVACKRTDCLETCPHPILVPGQCCPDCSAGCSYGRTVVQNNESFPSPSDPCLTCICLLGSVACSPIDCTISCTYPFHAEGECCPVCRDCTYEGRKVLDGQSFMLEKDACTQCTCQRGEVSCEKITCQLSCSEPYTPPGECCATCSECLYEGQVLEDGGYYVSQTDPCILCHCEAGNVYCEWKGDVCPQLVCEEAPIHPPGACCAICPDEDLPPLDGSIPYHFEEMEPVKGFRNPRGVTHPVVSAVHLMSPHPRSQHAKPQRDILQRKIAHLVPLQKLAAKGQAAHLPQDVAGSSKELHSNTVVRTAAPSSLHELRSQGSIFVHHESR
ncbi:von Willebrand factor C and EGF domain-containing protein isoform X2 [Ambystoma mexicanum]|uniref:von Willebrand factor C and EGF domain-containing protein isoform X2 n=1 Tax=Ambystoma mexicanum TaxID=8296 RepID=UPI0037E9A82F